MKAGYIGKFWFLPDRVGPEWALGRFNAVFIAYIYVLLKLNVSYTCILLVCIMVICVYILNIFKYIFFVIV